MFNRLFRSLRSPRCAWALFFAWHLYLAIRALRKGPTFDFGIYWQASRALGEGGSLYEGSEAWHDLYFYSPAFAIFFRPLSLLNAESAHVVWTALGILGLGLGVVLMRRVLERSGGHAPRITPWPMLLGLLFVAEPLASNFRYGNSNTIVLLLLVAGLVLLSVGRGGLAGVVLALAAVIKVTPLVLLPWLLIRREGRAVVGFLAGLLLFVAVVPGLYLGAEKASTETRAWVGRILLPALGQTAAAPAILTRAGCSLPRVFEATLSERPALPVGVRPEATPQLAAWPAELVRGGSRALGLLMVLAVLWLACRDPGPGALSFGLLIATTPLVAPTSHLGHFVALIPLVMVLGYVAIGDGTGGSDGGGRQLARWTLGLGVSAGVLLLLLAIVLGVSGNALFPTTASGAISWIGGVAVAGAGARARVTT